MRLSQRLRLPVVTSFLVLGLAVGPEGLGLVSASTVGSLRIIEPIALGMITYSAGEQLLMTDVRAFSGRSQYVAIALETSLPVVLVAAGAWLATGRLEIALPVGAIAGTTGLATVMSTLRETGAKGDFARLLGFSTATDNFFAILVFALVMPLAAAMETGRDTGAMYVQQLVGMAASIVIGFLSGLLVSRLVAVVKSAAELSMVVLAHVLLVVGITYYFGFSVLLAGLTMGATVANLTREVRDRERAFTALHGLEFPVVAMFFLWAGANLHIRALADIGLLFGIYFVARAVGKLIGPLLMAWGLRRDREQSRTFVGLGFSLLPQAGAAVGLAVLASDSLPASGQSVLAAVLGAVVVFELIGPMGVHWAARHVGEAREASEEHPFTLAEAIKRLEESKPRVVVISGEAATPGMLDLPADLVHRLEADLVPIVVKTASEGGEPTAFALIPRMDDDKEGKTDPLDREEQESQEMLPLASDTVDDFVKILKDFHPHILFLSLPPQVRELLGPADVFGQKIGCPVVDVPCTSPERPPHRKVRLPSVEEIASAVAVYEARLRRATRLLSRRARRGGKARTSG